MSTSTTEEYTIEKIEATVKGLKNSVLDIGYQILDLIDSGELVSKELIAEQKMLEKQFTFFSKTLNQMKKANGHVNSFSQILSEIDKVKLEMADINQNLLKK